MGPVKTQKIVLNNLSGRRAKVFLLLLVLIPSIFNAFALLPELYISIPSLNDDAFHYLLVQRASEALANGENPFDHWVPELELGFPQFSYYQHLPHLAVIFVHRLLLKQVDLFTLFNLIRYLLLICFPVTVYWSMRRMGFSAVAGAIGSAVSTLLSSNYGYGLEHGSYTWHGYGMYTQLWAMHLSFITLACLHHLLEQGKGYVAAIIACSALILSHLVYAYLIAIAAIGLFLFGLNLKNGRPRWVRFMITALLVGGVTSYFWFPFLIYQKYLGASPYLQRWKYDSFGAADILTRLVNGDLLDYGRYPVLTLLLALGVASALLSRIRLARLTLLFFVVWLLFFFGRYTWGRLADLLPMHEGLLFHRFIGGVHLAAILLIGIGGEWLWHRLSSIPEPGRALITGVIIFALIIPAIKERQRDCTLNKQWMERTREALETDQDAQTILLTLKKLPPGRAYAGLREKWGKQLNIGDLYFYNLLTFHRIDAVLPPYQSLSLSSDLIWHFDDQNPNHYNLFNVRYVVAPKNLEMPGFLRLIKETFRYKLYQVETSGYAQFATLSRMMRLDSQSSLISENRSWLLSGEPGVGRFVRFEYRGRNIGSEGLTKQASSGSGRIMEEQVFPGRFDLRVECQEASALVLKMTYHPNWRVTVDGHEVQTVMVSPSFIGFEIPAGDHSVHAEYRSPIYKTILLILGACVIVATVWFRGWFGWLET